MEWISHRKKKKKTKHNKPLFHVEQNSTSTSLSLLSLAGDAAGRDIHIARIALNNVATKRTSTLLNEVKIQ